MKGSVLPARLFWGLNRPLVSDKDVPNILFFFVWCSIHYSTIELWKRAMFISFVVRGVEKTWLLMGAANVAVICSRIIIIPFYSLSIHRSVRPPRGIPGHNFVAGGSSGTLKRVSSLQTWSINCSRSFLPLHVIFAIEVFWNNSQTYFKNA
jgi:hypothetical protein